MTRGLEDSSSDGIVRHDFGAKRVYVFEKHHYALLPWAKLRGELQRAPRLLTFDYHTDTRPAFVSYAVTQFKSTTPPDRDQRGPIADALVSSIEFKSVATVRRAVARLRYDEQIDAAIRSDLLSLAFVVAYQDTGHIISNEQRRLDTNAERDVVTVQIAGQTTNYRIPNRQVAAPPFTYTIPENRIVVLPKAELGLLDHDVNRAYKDAAIDNRFLRDRLNLIESICSTGGIPGLYDGPFILDIDLDYFNTRKAIAPNDTEIFYDLIRRAEIITIARESSCVKSCQIPGEKLTSELLQDAVLRHIASALRCDKSSMPEDTGHHGG